MAWISGKNRSLFFFALASFGLRFILLIQYANQNPFFVRPVLDSAFYLNWADALNSGKNFFDGVYHHPPGYAFFLAAILRLSGENIFSVLLIQCVMMECLGLLIFRTTEDLISRSSAWLCYVLFTLCGPLTFYSMKIVAEPLYMLLLFGSFYCIWRYTKEQQPWKLFAGAVLLGMAIEVRGNAMICIVPAGLAIFQTRAKSKSFAIFTAGILLFVLPVLVRNVIRGNAWTPVAANWGENIYFANNPTSTGSFSSAPGLETTIEGQIRSVQRQASILAKRDLNPLEAQDFWFHKAIDYVWNDPADWLKLETQKVVRLFAWNESSSIYYYGLESKYFQPFLKWLFIDYAWIVPLFFLGLLCLPGLNEFRLLFGYIIAQIFLLLVFWPELRFILPVFPYLLIVAAGLAAANRQVLQRKIRLAIAFLAILFWCIVNFGLNQTVKGREAWFTNAASAYYAEGKNSDAERMAREALKINPNYADAWVNLGAVLYSEDRIPEAKEAWFTALRVRPNHIFALRNLALLLEKENPQEALNLWKRALNAARDQNAPSETISAIEQQIKRLRPI
jgi:tetratricopeptide (TPR) repeat protein